MYPLRRDRGDQDDPAVVIELLVSVLGDEVDGEHLIDLLPGNFLDGPEVLDAGVAHDDVELAELAGRLLEQTCDVGLLGDVGFDGDAFDAQAADLLRNAFCGRGGVGVIDDYVGPVLGETGCYGSAYAAGRASD